MTVKYSRKIKEIIKQLESGEDREVVARNNKYVSFKSLNSVMNRNGYKWDDKVQTFVEKPTKEKTKAENDIVVTGKPGRVIEAIKNGIDISEIAKELGFGNHRDLADYMTKEGFEWDSSLQNYIRIHNEILEHKLHNSFSFVGDHEDLNEVWNLLIKNKERFKEILLNEKPVKTDFPYYPISGRRYTKSVQITDKLDELFMDFCKKNNVKQTDMLRIAIIELLINYGYQDEVNKILD